MPYVPLARQAAAVASRAVIDMTTSHLISDKTRICVAPWWNLAEGVRGGRVSLSGLPRQLTPWISRPNYAARLAGNRQGCYICPAETRISRGSFVRLGPR